jgi:hypothetical protein
MTAVPRASMLARAACAVVSLASAASRAKLTSKLIGTWEAR